MTLLLPSDNCPNQSCDGDLAGRTWTARSSPSNGINLEPSSSQPSLVSFGTDLLSVARTTRLCWGWSMDTLPHRKPAPMRTGPACALSSMTSMLPRCGISEIVYDRSRLQLWTMIVRWHPPLGQLLRHWTLSHPIHCTSWSKGVPPSPALLTSCQQGCWRRGWTPCFPPSPSWLVCLWIYCCRSHVLEEGACDSSPKERFTRQ